MSPPDPDIPIDQRECFLKEPILKILKQKIREDGLNGPTPYQVGMIHTFVNGYNSFGHDIARGGRSLGLVLAILQQMKVLPRDQDTHSGDLSSEMKDLQVIYICPDRDGCWDTKKVFIPPQFLVLCICPKAMIFSVSQLILEWAKHLKLSVIHCYGGLGPRDLYRTLEKIDDPQGLNLICACPGRYDSSFYIFVLIDSFREHVPRTH